MNEQEQDINVDFLSVQRGLFPSSAFVIIALIIIGLGFNADNLL